MHRHLPVLERLGDRLELHCPYAVDVVQAPPGIRSRNAIPLTRLFVRDPDTAEDGSAVGDCAARRRIGLPPGRILLLPPDRLYDFSFAVGMRMAAFHFRLEWSPGCDAFAAAVCAVRDDQPILARTVCAAARAGESPGAVVLLRGLLLQLAALFITAPPPSPGRFRPALELIERRCRADLRIGELAAAVGMCREHFARRFRQQLGLSPREQLHRRLAQRAGLRLLAGARVREVAEEFGFSSESVFSRFFKQRTGQAPRRFAAPS